MDIGKQFSLISLLLPLVLYNEGAGRFVPAGARTVYLSLSLQADQYGLNILLQGHFSFLHRLKLFCKNNATHLCRHVIELPD